MTAASRPTWSQAMDGLSEALYELLRAEPYLSRPGAHMPLAQVLQAIDRRDATVTHLDALVTAAIGEPTQLEAGRQLTLDDLAHRPAQTLQSALNRLPCALPANTSAHEGQESQSVPGPYVALWRETAHAAEQLRYWQPVLPRHHGPQAWGVVRELAECCLALPALDEALAGCLHPYRQQDEALALSIGRLTHSGHDALRISASEILARVPSTNPVVPITPVHAADAVTGRLMNGMTRTVRDRGQHLTHGEVRAVGALLEEGAYLAVRTLSYSENPEQAPGLNRALLEVATTAAEVRRSPVRGLAQPNLALGYLGGQVRDRLAAAATVSEQLPHRHPGIRQVRAVALTFAQQAPLLARELDVAVRNALESGWMTVPATEASSQWQWITTAMRSPLEDETHIDWSRHKLLAATERLSAHVAPETADPVSRSASDARRHAGLARHQLHEVLGTPPALPGARLSEPLSSHPRLAAPTARYVRR